MKKTVIKTSRANLLLDLLTFFFKKTTEYFLPPPLFICTFHRCILPTGEKICWICFNFTALPQFLGVHPRANGRWLTDQSERTWMRDKRTPKDVCGEASVNRAFVWAYVTHTSLGTQSLERERHIHQSELVDLIPPAPQASKHKLCGNTRRNSVVFSKRCFEKYSITRLFN